MAFREHGDVVSRIKAELQSRGVDLNGPCGAFQITKRVAWALRAEGAGLLSKPGGNNCDGFAVDIVMYADGAAFDVLSDSGGANVPAWGQIEPLDPARFRAAIDPGDGAPAPIPLPTPGPAPAPSPLPMGIEIEQLFLESVERLVNGLEGMRAGIASLEAEIGTLRRDGVRLRLR
jgi:hypothetical protein